MKTIIVYGENHFLENEAWKNIKTIIKKYRLYRNVRKIVLSELWYEDIKVFDRYNIPCRPLEDDLKNEKINYETDNKSKMKKSFYKRELSMIKHLRQALKYNDIIFIIVGDTHLRITNTEELGIPLFRNFLNILSKENKVFIYRSRKKEIE